MYIFFTDEASVHGKGGKSYGLSIYGGPILDEKQTIDLTDFLFELKNSYVWPQELELKWRFETVWENMRKIGYIRREFTKDNQLDLYQSLKSDHEEMKNKVMERVSSSSAKIVIAIRPNKLLGASEETNIEYSVGVIAKKFRKILRDENEVGILLADELRKKIKNDDIIDYQYILRLCCQSRNCGEVDPLLLIIPTIASCVSPIHQINDTILGAVQYYILEFMRTLENDRWDMYKARGILDKITGNFYKNTKGGYIINNGILLYPPKNTRKETRAGIFLNKLENQLKIDFNIN